MSSQNSSKRSIIAFAPTGRRGRALLRSRTLQRAAAVGLTVTLSLMAPGVSGQEAASPDLSDPEVAHVAVTANAIDVRIAELAKVRTSQADVRAFAETMIRDHQAVNERAAALAGKLGVTPADNDVSRSLEEGAAAAMTELEGLSGAAFDRAFMAREVAYHQAVLDALDGLLIPTTSNDELRALLEQVRPVIAAHLEHARMLQTEVTGG